MQLYTQVQLALLTATVKLFIKRPTAGQELVPKVLKWATEDVDNPDLRDRGFIYWRLLSTDPGAATDIVFAEKPPISTESEAMDPSVLDRLLLHTGTLSSLYGKEPQTFIRGAKAKVLHDSPALDPSAKRSYLDSLNLPALRTVSNPTHAPPVPAPAVPPKPVSNRQDSNGGEAYGRIDTRGDYIGGGIAGSANLLGDDDDDEDEAAGLALNPSSSESGGVRLESSTDEPLDPYSSLARLSIDGFRGVTGSLTSPTMGDYGGGGYGEMSPKPFGAQGDSSLL